MRTSDSSEISSSVTAAFSQERIQEAHSWVIYGGIRKETVKNTIFDVTGCFQMMKKYSIYKPSVEGTIYEEWTQCLGQIKETWLAGNRPLKLNIFTSLTDSAAHHRTRDEILRSVIDTFDDQAPAISVTVHPPQKPWKIAVEALFIISCPSDVTTKFFDSIPYVVTNNKWGKEVWGAGLGSDFYSDDTRKAAEAAFNQSVAVLAQEDMSLNHIIRQWNYIGNILTIRGGFQNYQVFNEVRSEYYNRYRTVIGYPAATGIGMKLDSVIIDFCAVKPDESVRIKGLSNPNQVNAYEYGQKVLKGIKNSGKEKKQPPQFERALIISFEKSGALFISGTASIIGQVTIGKNNINEQTIVTIENIKKLADAGRISQVIGEDIQYSVKYNLLRVYIKSQKDFIAVKAICNEHFPSVPSVFIEADVCRNDLLTEIEGELVLEF
ncbi:MAG: dioxygenase [Bacteroidia bacterium]|nr:dioxygenase [Bacteroidia bacterium]